MERSALQFTYSMGTQRVHEKRALRDQTKTCVQAVGASQEPHWRLSHPSVRKRGRRRDRYPLNSLCDEA